MGWHCRSGHPSAVGGGWSIGIEFVFYLIFPVCAAIARSHLALGAAALLLLGQWGYYTQVLAEGTLAANWTTYIHVVSFAFYFFIGCWIGHALQRTPAVAGAPGGETLWR